MAFTKKIYEQVRELIEEDAGGKAPGESIDTEVGYAKRFGVSRPTVRKAVEDLIAIGMIKRIAGKGLVIAAEDDSPERGKLLIALPQTIGDGFFYHVTMGCVDQANHLGFEYKIFGTEDLDDRLALLRQERLGGYTAAVTCCYGLPKDREALKLLQESGLPVLLVDNPYPGCASISCDDYKGGYLIGQYLAKKGHRNIVNPARPHDSAAGPGLSGRAGGCGRRLRQKPAAPGEQVGRGVPGALHGPGHPGGPDHGDLQPFHPVSLPPEPVAV